MNYIAELNAFYDRLELNPQPNQAIALWHALMSIANKARWPDTFTVASSVLCLRAGLSASAMKRARNHLATNGFIKWKPRGGNLSATYQIISIAVQYEPQSEPQSEPQTEPQSGLQSEPQCEPINKHKQKHKEDTKVSKKNFPPTVEEVRAYCFERNNGIDPQSFIDFYTANGWVQGKGKPIKDWKACVRTWERNKPKDKQPKPVNRFNAFPQREYTEEDYADIERRMMKRR